MTIYTVKFEETCEYLIKAETESEAKEIAMESWKEMAKREKRRPNVTAVPTGDIKEGWEIWNDESE